MRIGEVFVPWKPKRRLFLTHPAIINPNDKETEKTGRKIAGWSVEVIDPGLNDQEAQKIGIFAA